MSLNSSGFKGLVTLASVKNGFAVDFENFKIIIFVFSHFNNIERQNFKISIISYENENQKLLITCT